MLYRLLFITVVVLSVASNVGFISTLQDSSTGFVLVDRFVYVFPQGSHGRDILVLGDYVYCCGELGGNIFVAKIAQNGSIIWNITFGGDEGERCYSMVSTSEYLYIVGYTKSYGNGDGDIYIAKISLDGFLVWNITWGGPDWDEGRDLFYYNGSLYVLGWTWSFGAGEGDFVILKVSEEGDIIWAKTWGTRENEEPSGIYIYEDKIYVAGFNESEWLQEDVIFAVFDMNGDEIFNGSWRGKSWDETKDICVDSDGIYILSESCGYGEGYFEVVLLKFSLDGEYEWMATYGTSYDDRPSDMILYNDTLLITGDIYYDPTDERNIFIVQFDKNGSLSKSIVIPENNFTSGGAICAQDYVYTIATISGQEKANTVIYKVDFDSDRDGLGNNEENELGLDPFNPDTDNDGLTDGDEIYQYFTSPLSNDTDSDGMPDGWEVQYGLDPKHNDSYKDEDGDGLSNLEEYQYGTDPTNMDTDGDGFNDYEEIKAGTNPLDPQDYPSKWTIGKFICILLIAVCAGLVTVTIIYKKKG